MDLLAKKKGKEMKALGLFLALTVILMPRLAMASEEAQVATVKHDFDAETSAGYALGHVEGDDLVLLRITAASHYKYNNFLSFGPSVIVSYGNQSTDLFDKFSGAEIGFDAVAQKSFGSLTPFVRANVVLASIFWADGKIRRTITNGTEDARGMIEFPLPSGGTIATSESRVDQFEYKLRGKTQGAEISTGSRYAFTEQVSLVGELGYSMKSVIVNEARSSSYGMVGGAEYTYDQRRGIKVKGRNIIEGFEVDVERKARYLSSTFLALGVRYQF